MADATDNMAIDLHGVEKVYPGRVHALRGVDMQVRRGEIFGLLGPNGAGKTTLVKIMMTVIRRSGGDGTILGSPLGHKPTLRRVGYLPEGCRFAAYLTGREALEYYAALSKVGRGDRKRRADELLALVGMADRADARVRTYSKGMMQRIALAQALTHDPELVLLDEPTEGLDPIGRRDVRQILIRLREQGRTVFLNSHLLSEVEMVCDRVAILNEGKVVRQGRLEDLTSKRLLYEIELESGDPAAARDAVRAALTGPAAESVALEGRCLRVEGADAAAIQPAIDALLARGMVLRSIRPAKQSLEELFIETVTGPPATESAAEKGEAS